MRVIGALFVDRNEVMPFRDVSVFWLRAKQSTADAVKASLCRKKTNRNGGAANLQRFEIAQFEFAEGSIPRFGFSCLLSAFDHILRSLLKELRPSMHMANIKAGPPPP